jgi:hypothetical protein
MHGTVTQEWSFITPCVRDQVSEPGDSGSVILDDQYRPAAMLWAGNGVVNGVLPDVTYATPLLAVLRDIETRLGWETGSVVLC